MRSSTIRRETWPSREEKQRENALWWLCLAVFILFAAPKLRITIGSIPLYIIDLISLVTLYQARALRRPDSSALRPLVVGILVFAVLSEWIAGGRIGTVVQPIYIIARTLIAASLFFVLPKIVVSSKQLEPILKAALLGALITSTLMIMTSVPQTRALAINSVFSISILEPSDVTRRYDIYSEQADRGRSLVGVSILSAAFLNGIWALLFVLRSFPQLTGRWRALLALATILAPVGIVASYSRGAVIGLLLVIMAVLFVNTSTVRRPLVAGVAIVLIVVTWLGWDSSYFYFERLEDATELALEETYTNVSVTERLFSYTEPWAHVTAHPAFLFVGQGFARRTVSGHDLVEGNDAATHSVFAAAYYGYGLLAALLYVGLLFKAISMVWRVVNHSPPGFERTFSGALLAGLMGMSSWFFLGHAAVSEPRGAMFLFFCFGLVATLERLSPIPATRRTPSPYPPHLRLKMPISTGRSGK